ncbi:hypothetical protein ES332_D02G177200v1 [Gossypium tomentosum]|uniref:Uncharacterized protein n=1 Tax=Gossypium tomentosum TaxID=34277 RepID=A0A5D2LYJ2_GOSTO|nr:hypothetical protein ES332_D02G177200v1 [Gossypium tomentosum]
MVATRRLRRKFHFAGERGGHGARRVACGGGRFRILRWLESAGGGG